LVSLFFIPLIASRSISNETSIEESPSSSNETSIHSDSTLATALQRVTSEEYWKPWWDEKGQEMAELKEMVDQWKEEHPSVIVYISIGMLGGLFLLVIVIIIRTLATRLRRRKIGQLGGDALGRKKLMSEDLEEM
ncbi:hypothetical protein PENTCL1PPCAC_2349, partial [Pristionchus entomophagus]